MCGFIAPEIFDSARVKCKSVLLPRGAGRTFIAFLIFSSISVNITLFIVLLFIYRSIYKNCIHLNHVPKRNFCSKVTVNTGRFKMIVDKYGNYVRKCMWQLCGWSRVDSTSFYFVLILH
jgi:hypothetical protein